jgi:hypothetical protein
MSFIKVIRPGDQEFGEKIAQLVPLSHRGLRGNDLDEFVKRAGLKMADAFRQLDFAPGEVPVHLIALGASEYYGPNRNGDAFSEQCCKAYHDTFVKHARFYRNHANKDPQKSYGIIKASMYNEPMHRIELIAALNGTKEAAHRNGGLLADDEIDMLHQGKEIPVSMACKVAYDVCSICQNRARNKGEYCKSAAEGGECPGAGCFSKLGAVLEDGRIQFVDNPHPTWFDMSRVWKPADRIAYVCGQMSKAAGAHISLDAVDYGADTLDVTAPWSLSLMDVSDPYIRSLMKQAGELADLEREFHRTLGADDLAFRPSVQPPMDIAGLDKKDIPEFLGALANEKIALPLRDFIRLFHEAHPVKADAMLQKVGSLLPGIYGRLTSRPEHLEDVLTKIALPFRAASRVSADWSAWATKRAWDYSLANEHHRRRCHLAVIRGDDAPREAVIKAASVSELEGLNKIAESYAIYKLAFLNAVMASDTEFHLTKELVLRQNHTY